MSAAAASRHYFGTAISGSSFADWLRAIQACLDDGRRQQLFGHHNLHSLYLLHKSPVVADFYQRCSDCYIDGVPVGLLRAAKERNLRAGQRFSLMDHFEDLLQHAQDRAWRLFYLGSTEQVCAAASELVASRYPNLDIRFQNGYFSDSQGVVDNINRHRPQLLLVGMGMPRQEQWLLQHLDSLDVGVATQAGGTLDYLVGSQARPPRWLSRLGLAWGYRLLCDPGRLWRRYLVEPWGLIRPTGRYLFDRKLRTDAE